MGNRSDIYIIKCRTNLHVGSGGESFGLVDNTIQRETMSTNSILNLFSLPVINSSSLKGAFREFFTHNLSKSDDYITELFGSDSFKKSGEKIIHKTGKMKFFTANILSFPVRSNKRPYFNVTCPYIIEEFLKNSESFGYSIRKDLKDSLEKLKDLNPYKNEIYLSESSDDLILEDQSLTVKNNDILSENRLKRFIGDFPALIHNENFIELCDDSNLPVIARNHLENGISKNLWHEQVIPRETKFYFFTMNQSPLYSLEFSKDHMVQIGANGSIGYGYCEIENLKDFEKEN